MQSHFKKENEVVLSYRWHFQDGRSKGMGTEWDKEVVGKVGHQKSAQIRRLLRRLFTIALNFDLFRVGNFIFALCLVFITHLNTSTYTHLPLVLGTPMH